MKPSQWLGISGITLGVLVGTAANGQVSLDAASLFPRLGVARSPSGVISLMQSLSGLPQAAPLDRDNVFTEHQSVAARNREMATIRVGMTREQLLRVFESARGFYVVPPWVYSYRKAPNEKVKVEFDNRDPTSQKPTDKITKISKPYWEQVFYD